MNAYAYRLPGAEEPVTGKSKYLRKGVCGSGFLLSPFGRNPDKIFTIPDGERFDVGDIDRICRLSENDSFPDRSTTREQHAAEVEAIRRAISRGVIRKAVAARCIVLDVPGLSAACMFRTLCEAYPEAYVFCFHTQNAGMWMGASPELLLSCRKGVCTSMSLAGTRPTGTDGNWDTKNIEEQAVVTSFIRETFERAGACPVESDLFTKEAGPVEHLCRIITGQCDAPLSLAMDLSPTPALCGYPREAAAAIISAEELFPRAYYGGFSGSMAQTGDLDLYVNLRCMQIGHDRIALYTGGGIMADSDPDAEWEETTRKMQTMIKPLNLKIYDN